MKELIVCVDFDNVVQLMRERGNGEEGEGWWDLRKEGGSMNEISYSYYITCRGYENREEL